MRRFPTTTLLLAAALGGMGIAIPIVSDELDIPSAAANQLGKRDQVPLAHAHIQSPEEPYQEEDQPSPTDGSDRTLVLTRTQTIDITVETISTVSVKQYQAYEPQPQPQDADDLPQTEVEYLQSMVDRLQKEINSRKKQDHTHTEESNSSDLRNQNQNQNQSSSTKAQQHFTTLNQAEEQEGSILQVIKQGLNYQLLKLEIQLTPAILLLSIVSSILFIEIFYRIRAFCSRRSRLRRMLLHATRGESPRPRLRGRSIDESERFFEEASYYRSQVRQRRRSGGYMSRLWVFSRWNRKRAGSHGVAGLGLGRDGLPGYAIGNGNYGNEAGLGGRTPPPAYEDYGEYVSDGFCGGGSHQYVQTAHTQPPLGFERGDGDFAHEKGQQWQYQQQDGMEYGEEKVRTEEAEEYEEYNEKDAMMVEEEQAQEEEEQEQEQDEREVEEEGQDEREDLDEQDLMSISQEIASFRSVADMVSEIVAATAHTTERR